MDVKDYWIGYVRVWQQSYNPNEDYTEAEVELRARLATFLDCAKAFNIIYAKVGWLVNLT